MYSPPETNMTVEKHQFEDVSPIILMHGDFPGFRHSIFEGKKFFSSKFSLFNTPRSPLKWWYAQ